MNPAAKHMDPVFGVDTHIMLAPPAAQPTPLPTPYVGMVFDPFDYLPIIGSTVSVNGLPRAQAGTAGVALPMHLPTGGPFGPPPPSNESEVFMGSTTVNVDGDAQSFSGLPALSCQSIGMPAPFRPKGQPAKSLVLPTSTVLSIPMAPPVLIGGPPTISLSALGGRAAGAMLGKLGKGLRKVQRGPGKIGQLMRKATDSLQKAGDKAAAALKLGPRGRNAVDKAICTLTGHPVDVATGKVLTEHVDFALSGPLALRWERVWYSTSTYRGPLGHGWHHSYDAGLYVAEDVVLYRTPDGRLVALPPIHIGEEHFDRSERLTFTRSAAGYQVRTVRGVMFTFRDIGRPNAELVLSTISDGAGSVVRLAYDDLGRLAQIIDTAGREIEFTHDNVGRLTRITGPHPTQSGQRFNIAQYQYDDRGNLIAAIDALSQPFRYAYQRHLLVRETNRNGLSFVFEWDGTDESARCLRTFGDGGIYDHKLTYDLDHSITTVTNSLGHKTQYQYENGLVVRLVDPKGAITRLEYDADHRLLAEIDPLGRSTRFKYDDRGNVVEVEQPDGSIVLVQYDSNDQPVAATDANGNAWQWSYDGAGRLVEIVDPLEHARRFAYNRASLAAVVDPLGHTFTLERDPQHNLAAIHAPGDIVYRWHHDALGRAIEMVDPNGNVNRRTYDLLGRVVRVETPNGNVRTLRYDPEGNVLAIADDKNAVQFTYRGMGKVETRTQGGTTISFGYDTEERLISIINEHGDVYRFALDPNGELISEEGFGGHKRVLERDVAGRIRKVTRASGQTSRYSYDAGGRVSAVEYADGSREAYRYRSDGALIGASNRSATLAFDRDPLGRVVRESSDSHWVSSEYDARGCRVRMCSSLGAEQRYTRDALGHVTALQHAFDPASEKNGANKPFEVSFARDALGLEIERSLPGGVRVRWKRSPFGLPLEQQVSVVGRVLRTRGYDWDQADRLRAVLDGRNGRTEYNYDAVGNLAWTSHSDGSRELRMPDAVGNLFRTEARTDRRYTADGQLEESTSAEGQTTRYVYDADGNLIEKVVADGRRWSYRWNADGTMREVVRPDGAVVAFAYDPLGRRIRKTFGRRTTCWVWDGNVPLHEWEETAAEPEVELDNLAYWDREEVLKQREAERDRHAPRGPPTTTWVFEPESFAPLAKLVGSKRHAIVVDHLGAPHTMLDERGEVTWSAELGALGQLQRVEGDRAACPFRWPGQYEDVETGLYYNRFRYYDPEAGAYVSRDPLGIAGGLRSRAYPGDPTRRIDPLGLIGEVGGLNGPIVDSATHLSSFDNGVSVFVPETALTTVVPKYEQLGRSDGLFVTTPKAADQAEAIAGGNRESLKQALGIPPNEWNEPIHRVDFSASEVKNLRMATGKEGGANKLFIPGGYTSGGVPEAVVDPVPEHIVRGKGRCVAK